MIKYLVLAGNHKEAQAWANEKGLKAGQWLYIFNLAKIEGYNIDEKNTDLVLVGTYHKRTDLSKIMDRLAWFGFVV